MKLRIRSAYDRRLEADDRKFKTMKESFDKTTDVHGYLLSTKNTGMHTNEYLYLLAAMIDKVLTRLLQTFFKERRRTMA